MIIVWVLVPCLIGGAFFFFIAAWLTTKKGNTISDILRSKKLADAEAIKLEILGKVRISSTIPIVALAIVAAFVAVGLPAFISWQLMKNTTTITLSGDVEKDTEKKVYATPENAQISPGGGFNIPIIYSDRLQTINFEGRHYKPVTLSVKLNKLRSTLKVSINGATPVNIPIDLEDKTARYNQRICFLPDSVDIKIPNELSQGSPIDSKFKNVGEPQEVGK